MLPCQLNIAVDGPAGAGKSTVSKAVARALGLSYLDTGSMYRALTWKALESQLSPVDGVSLAELARSTDWSVAGKGADAELLMDGQMLPDAIRSDAVTSQVSAVSSHQAVREAIVARQRLICSGGGFIADGRDIGSVVMPDADLKVFLTAAVEERARRRLLEQGRPAAELSALTQEIARRDYLDSHREHSPLCQAEDAWLLDTTGLTFDQVVERILDKARSVCTKEV